MAWMLPATLPPDATPGEGRVFRTLQKLPPSTTVWYRRLLAGRHHVEEPDFILLAPELGLVVLEVKDWRTLPLEQGADTLQAPLAQAKRYVHALEDQIRRQGLPVLVHAAGPHQGKLVVPCVPVVVFPFLSRQEAPAVEGILDGRHALFQEDLTPGRLASRLQTLVRYYFTPTLTTAQLDYLRGLIAPELCLQPPTSTEPPRLLDPVQTQLVLTDLILPPPPGPQLVRDLRVRLVRGVAGSGKTLLLLFRAKLLHALQPNWELLILTYTKDLATYLRTWYRRLGGKPHHLTITHFHKWCRDQLQTLGAWQEPLDEASRRGLLARLRQTIPGAEAFAVEFLAEELQWLKESVTPLTRDAYLKAPRRGRETKLTPAQREIVFQVFEQYQATLTRLKRLDWAEVPLRVLQAIEEGRLPRHRYHAILVDETQDFAPSWFRVILPMVKPETNLLFLVGDGAQRLYRRDLRWAKLGIPLTGGRSRILRRVYRNTVEIATFAATFLKQQRAVLEELAALGEAFPEPDVDHPWARHGPTPSFHSFATREAEATFLGQEITQLLHHGVSPAAILVLGVRREGLKPLVRALTTRGIPATLIKQEGLLVDAPTVKLGTVHSAKGLEFPIVFFSLTDLLPTPPLTFDDDLGLPTAEAARLLYVGMTRAQDRLYLMYAGEPHATG